MKTVKAALSVLGSIVKAAFVFGSIYAGVIAMLFAYEQIANGYGEATAGYRVILGGLFAVTIALQIVQDRGAKRKRKEATQFGGSKSDGIVH